MGETVHQPGDPAAGPGRNRRGEKTRHELIEAAWRVVDRMSLVELLSGLTPSVVAGEAGVTTGAVRHHFPDLPALVEAMVRQQVADHQTTYVRGAAEVRANAATYDAAMLRDGARAYWAMRAAPGARQRSHRWDLLASRARQTCLAGAALDALLAEGYARSHVELDAPTLDALLERLGRTWVPPFDGRSMSRIIESLCEGLLYQSDIEPELVTADLFADALSAILLTFSSTGSSTSVSLDDFGLAEGVAPVYDVHRAQEAAVAALAVFDRDPADLTLVQVALETGQQVAELVGLFGTVRRMAAVSFVAVYPRLVEAANRHLISDPYRALVDGLCEIARMGRSHPHVARALLVERTCGPEDEADPLPVDIRMVVPIGIALVNPLRRTEHVTSSEMASVIGDLVDTTLRLSAENPRRSPADIAVEALGALPSRQVSSSG